MGGRRFSSETIPVGVNIRNDFTPNKKYVKAFLMNLAANFSGGNIARTRIGRYDAVIGMDVDVGISGIDLRDQVAERMACQRAGKICGCGGTFNQDAIRPTPARG